jgi:hypothetical protein
MPGVWHGRMFERVLFQHRKFELKKVCTGENIL